MVKKLLLLFIVISLVLIFSFLYTKQANNSLIGRIIEIDKNITYDIEQISFNLKFKSNNVSYNIINCDKMYRFRIDSALYIIENSSKIRFYEINNSNAQIIIECSNQTKTLNNFSEYAEGGPTLISNSIILESKINIFNSSYCEYPVLELHELIHAFGFSHTLNKTSIMYPLLNCKNQLDKSIITKLNELY